MDRICPYLALADDGRTVADGFDPEHRCHALSPPGPLERSRQVQLCLTEAHARCERFAAARTAWLAASSGLPRVAPDVAFGRTRLVLEPEAAWRNLAGTPAARFSRAAIVIAVVALAVVGLLVLSSLFGMLRGAPGASQTPSASPSPSPSVSASPSPASAGPSAPASASAASTPPLETPAPSPPRTYVVQQGDTLNLIAQRFGTTAAAIQAANGLTSTNLDIGQVLIIP